MFQQTTSHILLIKPKKFGYNNETAVNNAFQSSEIDLSEAEVEKVARQEFDALAENLRMHGIDLHIFEDNSEPAKPDAVFPNNWVTFHQDGTVVTYPMFAESRRTERREDILEALSRDFEMGQRVRLEVWEAENRFLEGTGSLILDRTHHLAYACLSPRTDEQLLQEFCLMRGYEKVAFHGVDGQGQAIYHTNVMMALGETFVVICLESVGEEEDRQMLQERFILTGKEVIAISMEQMMAFAGNMLQVRNREGKTFLVMSDQAYLSLREEQIRQIETHTHIIHSPIDTIERLGGGSVRCMMAEIFLRPRSSASGISSG